MLVACVNGGIDNEFYEIYQFDAYQIYSVMTKPVQALAGRRPSEIAAMNFSLSHLTPPKTTKWFPVSRNFKQCLFFCREFTYSYKWCAVSGTSWDYCDDDYDYDD